MDFSDAFRIVNLVVGVLMILGGIGQFWPNINVQSVIVAVYVWIFGLGMHTSANSLLGDCANVMNYSHCCAWYRPSQSLPNDCDPLTICAEFQIPPQVARYASFMFSFIGRGVFYIFVGCIIMGDNWWKYLSGALITFAGIAYVAMEFTPNIEPPANMRDADAGWGAEQV
ncbi:Golgi apparatus membrane protein tvp15 [Pseudocercospora fuligena]|uniref:Golgi apparatus membrane protein tvp15 n=1 Tax=Pseudocercospora fuligena TaxID=685502 RepID=A0A8H6RCF5_9PEZI|nr:Golgi apparatus membrane protein tvp15 [Pseudocercospora fuligena]